MYSRIMEYSFFTSTPGTGTFIKMEIQEIIRQVSINETAQQKFVSVIGNLEPKRS